LKELKKLHLGGSREQIPTLREVLDLVDGQVPLLIELKGENGNTLLCQRVAAMLDFYRGSFCVESFNPLYLRWFRFKRPRYPRAQLVGNLRGGDFKHRMLYFCLRNLLMNLFSRPDIIACEDVHLRNPAVRLCTRVLGAPCLVWTVKSRDVLLEQRENGRSSIFEGFFP
jgi:glycerophosphoryl diester phosphodiesterase